MRRLGDAHANPPCVSTEHAARGTLAQAQAVARHTSTAATSAIATDEGSTEPVHGQEDARLWRRELLELIAYGETPRQTFGPSILSHGPRRDGPGHGCVHARRSRRMQLAYQEER